MEKMLKLAKLFQLKLANSNLKEQALQKAAKSIAYNIKDRLTEFGDSSIKFFVKYKLRDKPIITLSFSVFNPNKTDYGQEKQQYEMVTSLLKKLHPMFAKELLSDLVIECISVDIPQTQSVIIK